MANQSILNAFSRMWEHIETKLSNKSDKSHTHSYAASDSVGGAANSAKVCTGNAATAS